MSPPSSNDSSVAPPPPPFQPSASISDINNNISHSSPVLPAGITNRPTSPQHASNHQLPFTSTAPLPSVIPSPPCQPPSSPIHQSQPRARVRSRTPPLSLRPSHFATSIIPQNTRRRLRLRRSLSNAPILSTPQPSALTRPVSASQQHQPPVDSSAIIITQSQTNNPILSEINNQDNNVGNNGNILPSWNMPQPNSTLSPNRNYNNINNHNNSTNDNNNNMNNNSNNDNDNSTSTNFVNTTSNLSPPNLSTPHNDNIPNIVSTSTSHLPPRSLHSLAHSSSPSTVTTTPTSIPQPNHSSSLLTSHPSTQYASPQEPLASAGRNSVVSPYATPHIPSISSSATTPTPSNSAPTITPANDSNGNTAPRTIPRSSAIDELIAVLERNAPQIPPVRSNVISRTVSFQQDHQLSQQQQQSPQQPQAHHVSPGTRQVSNNDSDSCNLSRNNLPSFPDTPSGNASSNPDHSLHSTLPPQVATEAPGLACISTPHPQIAGTTNLQNASMDGITTSAPQPTIPSTHSDFHRPSSPFFPIPDSTSASTGVHTPFVASNRPRWIQTRSQNPPPSGTTTVPSLTSLPQPSHPPAAPLFSAPRLSAGNSNNYSNSNSNNTNNESNANNSFRASTGSSAGAGSSAGTGSGYGPPPGVPPSLWPMPPLTSLNESGSSLPPIVTVAGPMHRGISPYRSSIRHAHLSRRTSRPVSTPRTEAAPGPPHPLTMRSNHPAPTPPPPFLHPGGITGNQSSNHPNFSARTFTAPSLISVERQAASEPDNIFLSAQGSGIPSVRRVSGSANPVIDDDDDSMEHDRARSRDRERLRDIDRDTDRCRESNRRFGDMVADDELIGIGTSINSAGGPRTGFGASPSSTAANEGFGAGSSGRRSVSFNIDSFPQYDGREGEEVSAANATANASEPHNSNGMGFIQDGASEGEQMRRARMSRILRMMGRSPRRVAQVSDDMRLIFGNEEESGLSGDEMHPSRMRSGSAYSGALSVPASSAHTADTGNNQGGASGSAVGSGGVSVMEGRNSMDGMRSLMVSDDDSDVMMMGELETMEYLHSLHALHGRHRERDRERDRNRDRDREIERERFISSSLRGRGRGGIRGTARISRLPPIESMLRRCEVRAMVAGREFGVPCGLFEYSVRGRPSLTPNIDWPDVVLIMDENVKPRAPILDLMAQDHVQWCVRVGPLGNGEGDGRRGYQGFVNGLIEGGFAIEIEVARGMIYFWALTFPPHGQCLLGVFRPNSRTTANASSGVANVNAAQASTTETTSAPTVPMVTTTTGAS